ncbi:hypothetical protein [Megalodesulfovibrio paquesii]
MRARNCIRLRALSVLLAAATLLLTQACADGPRSARAGQGQSAQPAPSGQVPVRAVGGVQRAATAATTPAFPTQGAVHLSWAAPSASLSLLVPEETTGEQVDAARFFQPHPVPVTGGQVAVVVGADPVCLEAVPSEETPRLPAARNPFGASPASPKDGPDFSLAQDLGLGWHRGATAWWVALQPPQDLAAGRFQFAPLDAKLAALPSSMEAVVNIMLPERRTAPDRWEVAPSREAYAAFLNALLQRYGRRVQYWQFENEPDLGPGAADLPGFARLHAFTAQAIRRQQPSARLLLAGFTGLGGEEALDRQLAAVAGQLGPADAQIFDLHVYGGVGNWQRLDGLYGRLRARLDATGHRDAVIWMTETGTWTGSPSLPGPGQGPAPGKGGGQALGQGGGQNPGQPAGMLPGPGSGSMPGSMPGGPMRGGQHAFAPAPRQLPYQSERDQARELIKRHVHGFSLGIERIFWAYGLKEGYHDRGQLFDNTGLVYDGRGEGDPGENIPKLGYFAYKRLIRAMLGRDGPVQRLDLGPQADPAIRAYQFQRGGAPVIVLWRE